MQGWLREGRAGAPTAGIPPSLRQPRCRRCAAHWNSSWPWLLHSWAGVGGEGIEGGGQHQDWLAPGAAAATASDPSRVDMQEARSCLARLGAPPAGSKGRAGALEGLHFAAARPCLDRLGTSQGLPVGTSQGLRTPRHHSPGSAHANRAHTSASAAALARGAVPMRYAGTSAGGNSSPGQPLWRLNCSTVSALGPRDRALLSRYAERKHAFYCGTLACRAECIRGTPRCFSVWEFNRTSTTQNVPRVERYALPKGAASWLAGRGTRAIALGPVGTSTAGLPCMAPFRSPSWRDYSVHRMASQPQEPSVAVAG